MSGKKKSDRRCTESCLFAFECPEWVETRFSGYRIWFSNRWKVDFSGYNGVLSGKVYTYVKAYGLAIDLENSRGKAYGSTFLFGYLARCNVIPVLHARSRTLEELCMTNSELFLAGSERRHFGPHDVICLAQRAFESTCATWNLRRLWEGKFWRCILRSLRHRYLCMDAIETMLICMF